MSSARSGETIGAPAGPMEMTVVETFFSARADG
jgi:hypothetical protein